MRKSAVLTISAIFLITISSHREVRQIITNNFTAIPLIIELNTEYGQGYSQEKARHILPGTHDTIVRQVLGHPLHVLGQPGNKSNYCLVYSQKKKWLQKLLQVEDVPFYWLRACFNGDNSLVKFEKNIIII